MKIRTKLLRGKFYCYATVDGMDYSFDGTTMFNAQSEMRTLLNKKGIQDAEFEPLQVIEDLPKPEQPPIGYATSRIDNNPFG